MISKHSRKNIENLYRFIWKSINDYIEYLKERGWIQFK
jgi:hypothetical protein